jgi:S-adenosylmethionine synthetase
MAADSKSSSTASETKQSPVRVLITGATGLLGRALMEAFALTQPKLGGNSSVGYSNEWIVTGLGFSRVPSSQSNDTKHGQSKIVKCDLRDATQVSDIIRSIQPHVIIHSAAERRPDNVEKDPSGTEALNVEATSRIASIAKEVGAWALYISTGILPYC